jgi:hypothetical protein
MMASGHRSSRHRNDSDRGDGDAAARTMIRMWIAVSGGISEVPQSQQRLVLLAAADAVANKTAELMDGIKPISVAYSSPMPCA